MCPKVRVTYDLLVNLYLFRKSKIVRHLDHDDSVQDGLVGVVSFEFLPLGFIGMSNYASVYVNHAMAARGGYDLLLSGRNHCVQVFGHSGEGHTRPGPPWH